MPKKLELKLKKEALKKFGTSKSPRAKAYIFGILRKTGWKPRHQYSRSLGKHFLGFPLKKGSLIINQGGKINE